MANSCFFWGIVKDLSHKGSDRVVLFIGGRPFHPLLEYFRNERLSLKVEQSYARALGHFLKWLDEFPISEVRADPIRALKEYSGQIRPNSSSANLIARGSSPSSRRLELKRLIRVITWFSKSGFQEFEHHWRQSMSASELRSEAWHLILRADHTKFGSVIHSRRRGIELLSGAGRGPYHKSIRIADVPVAFPEAYIGKLLWEGFIRPENGNPRSYPWERWNLRDLLIVILLVFGGKRISEPFHIWFEDVQHDPSDFRRALVQVPDPTYARTILLSDVSGRRMTRQDYLREVCGIEKNSREVSGRRRVGWKGNLLHNKDEKAMRVFWIPDEAGRLFLDLWRLYLSSLNGHHARFPHAFLTDAGLPMGPHSFAPRLKLAVERIGLEYRKDLGTTAHGLRHWYGRQVERMHLDTKTGQLVFGHRNPESQNVYRNQTMAEISTVLRGLSSSITPNVNLHSFRQDGRDSE